MWRDVAGESAAPRGCGAFAADITGEGDPPGQDRAEAVGETREERDVDEQPEHLVLVVKIQWLGD
jgi:hypothetical protein